MLAIIIVLGNWVIKGLKDKRKSGEESNRKRKGRKGKEKREKEKEEDAKKNGKYLSWLTRLFWSTA